MPKGPKAPRGRGSSRRGGPGRTHGYGSSAGTQGGSRGPRTGGGGRSPKGGGTKSSSSVHDGVRILVVSMAAGVLTVVAGVSAFIAHGYGAF